MKTPRSFPNELLRFETNWDVSHAIWSAVTTRFGAKQAYS
jgi:hypothetical protein